MDDTCGFSLPRVGCSAYINRLVKNKRWAELILPSVYTVVVFIGAALYRLGYRNDVVLVAQGATDELATTSHKNEAVLTTFVIDYFW